MDVHGVLDGLAGNGLTTIRVGGGPLLWVQQRVKIARAQIPAARLARNGAQVEQHHGALVHVGDLDGAVAGLVLLARALVVRIDCRIVETMMRHRAHRIQRSALGAAEVARRVHWLAQGTGDAAERILHHLQTVAAIGLRVVGVVLHQAGSVLVHDCHHRVGRHAQKAEVDVAGVANVLQRSALLAHGEGHVDLPQDVRRQPTANGALADQLHLLVPAQALHQMRVHERGDDEKLVRLDEAHLHHGHARREPLEALLDAAQQRLAVHLEARDEAGDALLANRLLDVQLAGKGARRRLLHNLRTEERLVDAVLQRVVAAAHWAHQEVPRLRRSLVQQLLHVGHHDVHHGLVHVGQRPVRLPPAIVAGVDQHLGAQRSLGQRRDQLLEKFTGRVVPLAIAPGNGAHVGQRVGRRHADGHCCFGFVFFVKRGGRE